MIGNLDDVIAATLRAPRPRPEFVAGLLVALTSSMPKRVALLPDPGRSDRSRWLVAGTFAGAAGIALVGWRLSRRGVA